MDKVKSLLKHLSLNVKKALDSLSPTEWSNLNEISLICNQPLSVQINGKRIFLGMSGTTFCAADSLIVQKNDVIRTFDSITNSSSYAYNRFIKEGFLTTENGHRIGIAGNYIASDNKIEKIIDINSLCIRISKNIKTNADIIFSDIYHENNIKNTLIISPSGCGKTSMLRDISRMLSDLQNSKRIFKAVIIDERFEIASCFEGVSSLKIGDSSAVISGCFKSLAIPLAIRSMSPDVIITDELATKDDIDAVKYALASGCRVIASTHGLDENINELRFMELKSLFETMIVLSSRNGPGTIEKIVCGDI